MALWALLAGIFVVVGLLSQRAELVVLRNRLVECSLSEQHASQGQHHGGGDALLEETPAPSDAPSPLPPPPAAPPRVLMVTAEPPSECSSATAQWLGSRAMRNRLVYTQRQGWQLYWCTNTVDPGYPGIQENGMWNKPALLAKLLASNMSAGVEWCVLISALLPGAGLCVW